MIKKKNHSNETNYRRKAILKNPNERWVFHLSSCLKAKGSSAWVTRNHRRLAAHIHFQVKVAFPFSGVFEHTEYERKTGSRSGAADSAWERPRTTLQVGSRFSSVKWGTRTGRMGSHWAQFSKTFFSFKLILINEKTWDYDFSWYKMK